MTAKISTYVQKAGQALHTVIQELSLASQHYAQQAPRLMAKAPFAVETDQLWEAWKASTRLAQELAAFDEKMRELYRQAAALDTAVDEHANPQNFRTVTPLLQAATDVVVKATPSKKKATTKPAAKAVKAKPVAKPVKIADKQAAKPTIAKAKPTGEKQPNAQRVLKQLQKMLSAEKFTPVKHGDVSKAADVPLGSVGAALKKLVELKNLEGDTERGFRLVASAA